MNKTEELRRKLLALEDFLSYHYRNNIQNDNFKEAWKSLIKSRMWCGNILGLSGAQTPYSNEGNNRYAKDIKPFDNPSPLKMGVVELKEGGHHYVFWNPEKVDTPTGILEPSLIQSLDVARMWLRHVAEIEVRVRLTFGWRNGWKLGAAKNALYINVVEARNFLGLVLGEEREKNNRLKLDDDRDKK